MKRKVKPYGIRPRLSKKETIKQKIRRKKAAIKSGAYDPESGDRFIFKRVIYGISTLRL